MAKENRRRKPVPKGSSRRAANKASGEESVRSRSRQRTQARKTKNTRKKFAAIVAVLAIIFIAGGIYSVFGKNAYEIYVNDAIVCTVKKSNFTQEDITNSVTAQLAADCGTNVLINEEIVLKGVHASGKDIVTMEYALSQLKQIVTYKIEAAIIVVDGANVVTMNTTDEAQAVLDSIIQEYIPEDVEIVESGFVENVSVEKEFVDSSEIMTSEEAYKKLTVGSDVTKKYTIASSDSLYKIAANAGITVEAILNANPGMTIDTVLRVGQEINLTVQEPFLSVKTAENIVFTEKQEKEVEYQQDSSKPSSYKKVIQQGRDGQKEVTTQIIRINGFESEEKVISEKTTVEPVTEIIVVGTN